MADARSWSMLECVINISEGRRLPVVHAIASRAGQELLDIHSDPDHNRSVITVVGEDAARAITSAAIASLRLDHHAGVHPRIGVVDVVPFVPLGSASLDDALAARDRFARWAADEHGVPCFVYGPERTLPAIRKHAFIQLDPDTGPPNPHVTAGAIAVGARPILVAYNLWLADPDLALARAIATELRSDSVRTLGLAVGNHVQVSCNLIDPWQVGPAEVFQQVADRATVARAELVGLVPRSLVEAIDPNSWDRLNLSLDQTIEQRLEQQQLPVD